jgi:hypothetical protein
MKNPAPYLRKTIFALLSGNVTYNDGKGFNGVVDVVESGSGTVGATYQIFIGEYSDNDRSNKHNFGANASQLIEVVAEQSDSAKKHVDAIGELVMNLIKPTTTSKLLSGTDFTIMVIGKPSQNYITENSGDGSFIVRLLLRYSLLVNEN